MWHILYVITFTYHTLYNVLIFHLIKVIDDEFYGQSTKNYLYKSPLKYRNIKAITNTASYFFNFFSSNFVSKWFNVQVNTAFSFFFFFFFFFFLLTIMNPIVFLWESSTNDSLFSGMTKRFVKFPFFLSFFAALTHLFDHCWTHIWLP